MPSVDFKQFKLLWEAVEKKFENESSSSFTTDNVRTHLIAQNLLTTQTSFEPIKEKFLRYIDSSKTPQSVNLSNTIFNALYKYLGIRGLSELQGDVDKIGFLGRQPELATLESFLMSNESRILAVYGVPMIGKTELVKHFLKNSDVVKAYTVISVELNPNPDNAEQRIIQKVFGETIFGDFSKFSQNTLIVIQNFEETLKWAGGYRELHDIKDEYENIKRFLEKAIENKLVKLILESRFQIRFENISTETTKKTLPSIYLEGVEEDEFWEFYKLKGFTRQQFEKLCNSFNHHTGLLAKAYNHVEWIYQNRLTEAFNRPKKTARYLWDFIEYIISRLEKREILIICALTFLAEPIKPEDIYDDFLSLPDFETDLQIDDAFDSLTEKLLVQLENGLYDLNPYIKEVCYTFLKSSRSIETQKIKNLPYFRKHGIALEYDKVQQAIEKGDFSTFFGLIKELRRSKNYDKAHSYLRGALLNPYFIKWIVLDEIGITFKEQEKFDEAIRILEQAKQINSLNIQTLNELAICYRENGQLDKAIQNLEEAKRIDSNDVEMLNELAICLQKNKNYEDSVKTAKKAIKLGHYPSYSVLIHTYQEMNDTAAAFEAAKEGVAATKGKDRRLIQQLQELEKDEKRMNKLNVFLSYSHKDEEIKNKLDVHLSALKRNGKISTWNDRKIPLGTEWDDDIKKELNNAHIILLLISGDFICSEYIWNIELEKAIEKHKKGEAVVIPIFCRSCDFKELPFAKLQGLPKDTNFIDSQPNKDEALTEVAKGIRTAVEKLLK